MELRQATARKVRRPQPRVGSADGPPIPDLTRDR